MKEDKAALGKLRGFTYILFFIFCVMAFHRPIADAFHTDQRRILLAFVLLAFMQITTSMMYLAKYTMSIKPGKKLDRIKVYASRIRLALFGQYGALAICTINEYVGQSKILDIGTILYCIAMIYVTLKNLTVLQRGVN